MSIMLFAISTFSLLIIAYTMLCRANDLRWRKGWNWNVRLIGFALCGAAPIGIIGTEFYFAAWPSPYEAFFRLGLVFVFVTTPHLPPWWPYISGKERANDTN
jgi:hypothetical protein